MKNGIWDGKSLGAQLRKMRKARQFSMRELAGRAGVAVSFLSKVEAGNASPTIMTLQKILEAMECAVADFFSTNQLDLSPLPIVFPHGQMRMLAEEDRTWTYVFTGHPDIKTELVYEEYAPHTRIQEAESHTTDLCGLILAGELTLELPGKGVYKARKGDGFYLPAHTEHIASNARGSILKLVKSRMREKQ